MLFLESPCRLIRILTLIFANCSAGHFDRDMEFNVTFKGFWGNEIEQDLRSGKADIIAIQSFIAHFVIGNADGSEALNNAHAAEGVPTAGSMTKLIGYLSNNMHLKDPVAMTQALRSSPPLLQADESIEACFKFGRDTFILTTKRTIIVDKKGITGKSVAYKSYPHMYNKAFW